MTPENAIGQIKEVAGKLGVDLMKIHPAVPALNHKATQDEIYQALYRITKDIEVIKKMVIKLETSVEQKDI
ncbi:MAG: hypothetical protein ACO1QB_15530 [Verrucomicrobiales bacterium]